jgi:transposase
MRKLYLGIDFHKKSSTLCTTDEDGKEIEMVSITSSNLVKYLSNKSFALIGIEASGGVNHVVQQLKDSGHDVRIINSNAFKAVGLGGKKTDERDARAISQSLRVNFGTPVHHKSERSRCLKSMLVCREHLVQTRVDHVNHVRGTLREYGITMPVGMDKFLENSQHAVAKLPHPFLRARLEFLLGQVLILMGQEAEAEKALEELVKNDARVARLRTIPGVGNLGSIALTAVIDDISRFEDAKHFASYLGLVPKEHSSGGKRMMGSITRSGSEIARRYLIHGARSVLMHTNEDTKDMNRIWAMRLKDKSGMNKAVVAMAHRLARIAWSVLKNDRDYTVTRPEPKKAA